MLANIITFTSTMANPFTQFENDTIRIINKSTGTASIDLQVNVTPTKIDVNNTDLEINIGDSIIRDLINNGTESYDIIDITYKPKFKTFDAYLSLKVRKQA
jgi:hypothetical protein